MFDSQMFSMSSNVKYYVSLVEYIDSPMFIHQCGYSKTRVFWKGFLVILILK